VTVKLLVTTSEQDRTGQGQMWIGSAPASEITDD
jgi:hypothetical protein